MPEQTDSLELFFESPTAPFRSLNRKGALRYIASNHRGSLRAVTRFAPPTNQLPKMLLHLLGMLDFRVPGFAHSVGVSETFLTQVAELLGIPFDRVGIYVGEPNDQQKLVMIDVAGESHYVMKMAVGSEADAQIEREVEGGLLALSAGHWEGMVPGIQKVEPVCGRSAILIERIAGRQLTPEEFEAEFFGNGMGCWVLGDGRNSSEGLRAIEVQVGEWLDNMKLASCGQSLELLIAACRECGALDLRSPAGTVHGDFAPWNIIRKTRSGGRWTEDGRRRTEDEQSAPGSLLPASMALCAIDWEFSRADTPIIFDCAYAAWCYEELLGRTVQSIDSNLWKRLVVLGALWRELRKLN